MRRAGRSARRLCGRSGRARYFAPASPATRLSPDEGNRAGPTLAGIFGRRIATLPGYNFSDALKKLDIVWTPETVAKLFEVGPAAYTPGTKMPEQRIGSAEDRKALTDFLEKATQATERISRHLTFSPASRARADNPPWCAGGARAARRKGSNFCSRHRDDAAVGAHLDDVERARPSPGTSSACLRAWRRRARSCSSRRTACRSGCSRTAPLP